MTYWCPSCGGRAPGGVCFGPHPDYGQQHTGHHPFVSASHMTTVRMLHRAHAQLQAARPSAAR